MNDEIGWALRVADRICWDRAVDPHKPGLHGLDRSGHAFVDSSPQAAIEIAAACRILSTVVAAR